MFLYENQFHEAHVRELVYPGTPDQMEVEQWKSALVVLCNLGEC